MLPVMAICWAGLMLRYDQIERFLDAAVFARREAWAFSAAGCECIPNPPSKDVSLEVHMVGTHGEGPWDTLAKIPLIGFFIKTIIGYELASRGRREYEEPPLLGGGTKTVIYPYYMMCNEKSRSGSEILAACLCQTVKSLGLGFATGDCPMEPAHGEELCNN